jgi:hypothetical protein
VVRHKSLKEEFDQNKQATKVSLRPHIVVGCSYEFISLRHLKMEDAPSHFRRRPFETRP